MIALSSLLKEKIVCFHACWILNGHFAGVMNSRLSMAANFLIPLIIPFHACSTSNKQPHERSRLFLFNNYAIKRDLSAWRRRLNGASPTNVMIMSWLQLSGSSSMVLVVIVFRHRMNWSLMHHYNLSAVLNILRVKSRLINKTTNWHTERKICFERLKSPWKCGETHPFNGQLKQRVHQQWNTPFIYLELDD